MTIKIPSSLVWLAKKRKYITGQMRSAEEQHQKKVKVQEHDIQRATKAHGEHMRILKSDLAAIDRALRMHEIPINPDKIGPIRFQHNPTRTGYGQITRLIYKALADSHPFSITTTKITAFLKAEMGLELSEAETFDLHERIRHRLRGLYHLGKVERLHPRSTHREGVWCLPALRIQELYLPDVPLVIPPEKPGRPPTKHLREQ